MKKNYTIPIIVMILLFGMISFVTNLASPMGDILKNQFTIPNWQGTLGVFANFIAYALMGIRCDHEKSAQTTFFQAFQECVPGLFRFRVAHIESEDLPYSVFIDPVGDHECLGYESVLFPDLEVCCVDLYEWVMPFQRSVPKLFNFFIEFFTQF